MSEVFVELGARSPAAPVAACAAPFASLYLDARGNVRACCINSTHPLGNVTRDRLVDIWHGPRVRQLRDALAAGDYGLGCDLCRPPGGLDLHPTAPARAFDHLAGHDGPWPRQLELALSNRCNLQCEMCFGELSSSIRTQREGLPPLPTVYDDRFFEDLDLFLPHVEELHFIGGEPFLAPEAWRVWDRLEELGHRPRCHVTTNATIRTRRVERLLETFPVVLTVSLDGATAATYERIRRGARFDEVVANLDHFVEVSRRRGTWVSLAFCLSTTSWPELPDVLRFGEDRGLYVGVNLVSEPARLSLWRAPLALLEEVHATWTARAEEVAAGLEVNLGTWRSNLAWIEGAVAQARADASAADATGGDPVGVVRDWAAQHAAGAPVLEAVVDDEDRIVELHGAGPFSAASGVDLSRTDLTGRPFIALMSGPVVDAFGVAFTSHIEDRLGRRVRFHEMTFAGRPGLSVRAATVPAPPGGRGRAVVSVRLPEGSAAGAGRVAG